MHSISTYFPSTKAETLSKKSYSTVLSKGTAYIFGLLGGGVVIENIQGVFTYFFPGLLAISGIGKDHYSWTRELEGFHRPLFTIRKVWSQIFVINY